MRMVLIACIAATTLAGAPLHAAEGGAAPAKAVGCDNLVTLRKLIIDGEEGQTVLADYAGCREVAPDAVGAVERRTIIGGLPFECRTVPGSACLWIRP